MEILKRFRNKFIDAGVEMAELSNDEIQKVSIGDLIKMGKGTGYSGESFAGPKYEPIWKGTILMFLGIKGATHYFFHKGKIIWIDRARFTKVKE